MEQSPRRRVLQLCGAVLAAPLAGCPASDDTNTAVTPTETATDASSSTDTPTETATSTETGTETASPTPDATAIEAWTVDRLAGRVDSLLVPESEPTDGPAGPLYAATQAGEIARFDSVDGRHEWTTTARGENTESPTLAPVGDAVYAVSETFSDELLAGHVEALEPETGEVRWTFEDRALFRVLGVVEDLVVLAGEYIKAHPEEIGPEEAIRGDGTVYGLDRATGDERWTVSVPELRGADVASHGVYALETRDHETHLLSLHAIDLDGTGRWTVDTGTTNPNTPLATDDLLLAGAGTNGDTRRGAVGRYDPADGSLRWTAGDWDRGPDDLALRDGTIHAGGRPFLALDRDGSELFRVPGFVVPDITATPETLYNDAGSRVSAVDREAGKIRWHYYPERYKYVHVRAVLSDHVAVDRGIGRDRTVVLLDEMDGAVVGTFETPGYYFGTIGSGQRLFAGVGSDIVAYDVAADRRRG